MNYFRTEMKTFCQSQSIIYGKKKMIILDDIDMINQQSQQVFCNYMDKYKDNVCFVSVCSNVQKIIENLQSRMHILRIGTPSNSDLVAFMEKIIANEHMQMTEEAKKYILLISSPSIRQLMSNLEKIYIYCLNDKNTSIDIDLCKALCTNISFQRFERYIIYIKEGKLVEAIQEWNEISDYGYSVIDILDYFFTFLKITDCIDEDSKYKIIHYLCKYIAIFHTTHENTIELALFTNNIYLEYLGNNVKKETM